MKEPAVAKTQQPQDDQPVDDTADFTVDQAADVEHDDQVDQAELAEVEDPEPAAAEPDVPAGDPNEFVTIRRAGVIGRARVPRRSVKYLPGWEVVADDRKPSTKNAPTA